MTNVLLQQHTNNHQTKVQPQQSVIQIVGKNITMKMMTWKTRFSMNTST